MDSIFLLTPKSDWVAANTFAVAIRDGFPISPGHTLVIPKREIPTWFDASLDEQHAMLELVNMVKQELESEFRPDAYIVGFNAGEAAGQTVMHPHVHVIPRYQGDIADPRGGIRHVIPSMAAYWKDGE